MSRANWVQIRSNLVLERAVLHAFGARYGK